MHPGLGTSWLIGLSFILGLLWLVMACFEGLYLEQEIARFVPKKYSEHLTEIMVLVLLWMSMVALAVKGWTLLYTLVYLGYTLSTTFIVQPDLARKITSGIEKAVANEEIREQKAHILRSYYNGSQWKFVGGESIAYASIAALLAYRWEPTNSPTIKDLLIWPHFVLSIEILVSQSILIYFRYARLFRGLNQFE